MEHIDGESPSSDLQHLAQGCYDGVNDDEGYLIEGKTTLGFKDAEHKGKIARALLAFANRVDRDPRPSVLLLGLNRGHVEDDRRKIDPSDARKALHPFLGPSGLRWHFANLTVNGCVVHAITVEAPQWGDPIFTLDKEFTIGADTPKPKTYMRGAIFVREGSDSNMATPESIKALTQRAIWSDRYFRDVTVAVESGTLHSLPGQDVIPEIVDEERRRLLHFLEEPFVATGVLAKLCQPEGRTPEEYAAEVEDYVGVLVQQLAKWVEWLPNRFTPVQFAVQNLAVDFRSDVVLEVRFPEGCRVLVDPEHAKTVQRPVLPHAPSTFGWAGVNAKAYDAQAALARVLLTNDPYQERIKSFSVPRYVPYLPRLVSGNTVRFSSFDLRPRHMVTQEPVIVVVPDTAATVEVAWSLTATNCSGNPTGSLTASVATGVTANDLRKVIRERA